MGSKRRWTDMFKLNPSASNNRENYPVPEPRNPERKARWNPTKEQIEFLESTYASGKTRPTRDEIRAIRLHLQQYGDLEEANVFYWFQNRKSKNRRRQRRLIPASAENGDGSSSAIQTSTANPIQTTTANPIQTSTINQIQTIAKPSLPALSTLVSSFPNQHERHQAQQVSAVPHINLNQGTLGKVISFLPLTQSEFLQAEKQSYPLNLYPRHEAVTPFALTDARPDTRLARDQDLLSVMIDGFKYKAPRGPINVRAAFGPDVIMVDSSGNQIPTNERGFSLHGLKQGGDYFLLNKNGGPAPLAGFPQV